jgi:hypothetical protein
MAAQEAWPSGPSSNHRQFPVTYGHNFRVRYYQGAYVLDERGPGKKSNWQK